MKSLLTIIFAVLVSFGAVMPMQMPGDLPENAWYELARDEMGADVLTVRLHTNPSTGFRWFFEISDPSMLELLTEEYVPDIVDSQMIVCGSGGTWAASFRSFSAQAGDVTLKLDYARTLEQGSEYTRSIDMRIDENGRIEVLGSDDGTGNR